MPPSIKNWPVSVLFYRNLDPSHRALFCIPSLFLVSLFGTFLSKGPALISGYSSDDYISTYNMVNASFFLQQGRYGQALVSEALRDLGLSPTAVYFSSSILLSLATSVSIALGIYYSTRGRGSLWVNAVGALLISTHPYLTEYYIFRQATIYMVFPFVFLGGAFYLLAFAEFDGTSDPNRLFRFAAVILLVVLAASFVQTALLVFALVIFYRIACDFVSRDTSNTITPNFSARSLSAITVLLASVVLYGATYLMVRTVIGGGGDARATFLTSAQIPMRLRELLSLIQVIIFGDEPILSGWAKFFIAAGILCGLAGVNSGYLRRFSVFFFIVPLTAAVAVSIVAVSGAWWPAPRTIFAVSFGIGLLYTFIGIHAVQWARQMMIISGALAALIFTFHSNAMLHEQGRLNQWDRWVAGGIAHDLLRVGASSSDEIWLVGAGWSHPLRLKTAYFNINTSALSIGWATEYLFRETTGRDWNIVPKSSDPSCETGPTWPEAGSLKKTDFGYVVCLFLADHQ